MCCKEQEKLSEWNYRSHNAKNHVKGGHYLPETPQRTHGGEVRWVGAVGRWLILREVRPGPTDVEPLVDPHLEHERAPQEDRLPTRRPRHCRTQPLVGSCQNSAAPADLI
jgi:hypothetical protein